VPGPTQDSWRRDLRPRVFAIVFSFVLLLLVLLMFGILMSPPLAHLDARLSALVRELRTPVLTTVAIWVTHIADTITLTILTLGTSAGLWLWNRRAEAAFVLLTVSLGSLLGSVVQLLVQRGRPAQVALIALPRTFSFPSGHALGSFLYFGCLSFIVLGEVRRPALRYGLVTLFALITVAVGLSRVYLGVHYLGDVIAAWLLGGAILVVAILGYFAFTQPKE